MYNAIQVPHTGVNHQQNTRLLHNFAKNTDWVGQVGTDGPQRTQRQGNHLDSKTRDYLSKRREKIQQRTFWPYLHILKIQL